MAAGNVTYSPGIKGRLKRVYTTFPKAKNRNKAALMNISCRTIFPSLKCRCRSLKTPLVAITFPPQIYHDCCENHTTQVCHVRYAITHGQSQKQFDDNHSYNVVFGFHGYRNRENIHRYIGETYSESQKYAVYGS